MPLKARGSIQKAWQSLTSQGGFALTAEVCCSRFSRAIKLLSQPLP